MNLGSMRTQVRDIIGETTADFWGEAELNRYLNEAQYRFLAEANWPWLITEGTSMLTGADPDLLLTDGVAWTRHMNMTLTKVGDSRLYQPKRVTPTKGFALRRRYSTTTTASYPEWFYVTSVADADDDGAYQWVAKFIPTPTSDMDVDYQYFRAAVEMAGDNDTPDMPVEFHKALVHFAAGTAWLKELNGGPKGEEQFSLYQVVVDSAKRGMFSDPDDTPVVMGGDEPQYKVGVTRADMWDPRLPETLGP